MADTLSANEERCLESFRAHMRSVFVEEFGIHNEGVAAAVAETWFHCDKRHEHRFQELKKRMPEARRVLDLASGMGTAVLYGLSQGFDCFGIEPDAEKLRFTCERIDAGAMPPEWINHFQRAVGEHLPFHNASFDAILSYQTLEHVENFDAVLREMLRVIKPSGALHLRCPDYRGTFEGHYALPWLPLMPRPLARVWLRLAGRPLLGFETVRYITKRRIVRALRKVEEETPGMRLEILDLGRERFKNRLSEKNLSALGWAYPAWQTFRYVRGLFRRELQMDLWIRVSGPRPDTPTSTARSDRFDPSPAR